MSNQPNRSLDSLAAALGRGRGAAPVHLWQPSSCGDLDIRIAADGTWHYLGSPIGRAAMVELFASVLKREGEDYFLVTPVEKIRIRVDDAPFLAVRMEAEGDGADRSLLFQTNVGDVVRCGPDHPLRFEPEVGTGGLKPYLHIRHDLWALVTRALFYDLVELGETRRLDGQDQFGIASDGAFFPMAPAEALADR